MKKRILCLVLFATLAVCVAGCGEKTANSDIAASVKTEDETAVSSADETEPSVSADETEPSVSNGETQDAVTEETAEPEATLSSNIEDYTIEDIDVFIGNVVLETDYYYGPSTAFDIYKDTSDGVDMGHPMPGQQAIVYGKCAETGWWRLDLGRSGDYPVVYVPEECIEKP